MIMKKSILFIIFLTLSITIYFALEAIKENQINNYENQVFIQEEKSIDDKFNAIYTSSYFETVDITKNLLKKLDIKEYIKSPSNDFNYYDSSDRYIKIFDKNGYELYNNMPDDYTRKSNYIPNYIKSFINSLSEKNALFTEHTGVTISNLIPVFDKDFIGVFETRVQLDEIADKLNSKNIKTIFLLKEEQSKDIEINLSHSRQFLQNRYIINKNADKYYTKLIEQSGILDGYENKLVNKKDGYIIVKKEILDHNKNKLLDAYLVKITDNIAFDEISPIKNLLNIIMVISIGFLALFMYYLAKLVENRYYAQQNEKLLNENAELVTLSDKLDYNEKKLSNLFNLQPNIMFISNGVNIVQVNRRFMGFFRRYKTFENFRNKHNNIAELFEPCDQPYYISEPLIDSVDWLEYIIQNPKRLYKTIMSVDGEQHHFIIKVNEMEYVKNFNERYIVVAFVDITQDIKAKAIEKEKHQKTAQEEEFDLTYVIDDNIRYAVQDITNIIPTKQTIFKTNIDEYHGINLIDIDITFNTAIETLQWKFIIPVKTISYIANVMNYKYDDEICEIINKDLRESSQEFVTLIIENIIEELTIMDNSEFKNVTFELSPTNETETSAIATNNLYRFVMFVDNYQIDILIDFDNNTLKHIKQIQMLGMFFN